MDVTPSKNKTTITIENKNLVIGIFLVVIIAFFTARRISPSFLTTLGNLYNKPKEEEESESEKTKQQKKQKRYYEDYDY